MSGATTTELNPFTAQDMALAKSIVTNADALLAFYAKCTKCGTNVQALAEQVQAQRDYAASLVEQFGS